VGRPGAGAMNLRPYMANAQPLSLYFFTSYFLIAILHAGRHEFVGIFGAQAWVFVK